MTSPRLFLAAAGLALAGLAAPMAFAPAAAAVDGSDPSRFVDSLVKEGFGALKSGNKTAARAKFRGLLSQYFAVDQIGDRLIRRWRPQITPQQYAAYKAAFPDFIIGTYADRLYDYSSAQLKVVRAVPRGTSAAVATTVTRPGGSPINAVWTVDRGPAGYQVSNLTVGGVNLAVTQAADFDSYIQRNSFDKLVAFMKSRG